MREQDIDRLPASEKLRCTVKERIHESQQPVPVVVGSRYKLRIVVRVDTERASDSRAVHALNRPAVHDGEARHCRSDSSVGLASYLCAGLLTGLLDLKTPQ